MRKIISLLLFSAIICSIDGYTRCSETTQPQKTPDQQTTSSAPAQRPSKKVEVMTLDEAREAARYFKEIENDRNQAIALERVVLLTGDTQELCDVMHELATLHEKLGNYEDAGTIYEQYAKLFPGNPDINYMTYKMIDILSKQIVDVHHDQSKIKQLAGQADLFLSRFGNQDPYAKDVTTLRTRGYQLLTQSELTRARFYLDRYYYTEKASALRAAGKRLEEAEKVLTNLDFEPQIEKTVEKTMDAVRAEDFDKKSPEEQIAAINRALTAIAKAVGEQDQKSGASAFFKRMF